MSYTIEEVGKCCRKIIFDFEAIDLTNTIQQKLKEKQKNASFKGFRKGKVPLNVVENLYKHEAENEALNHFISEEFWGVIKKEGFKIIGHPIFDNVRYTASGSAGGFEVMFDIMPDFEMANLSTLSFNRPKSKVTEQDIENIKKQYIEYRSSLKAFEDKSMALSDQHFAVFDIKVKKADSGTEVSELSKEKAVIKVGNNFLTSEIEVADLDKKIIGMIVDGHKEIEWISPKSGEKLLIDLNLVEIKELHRPDFNDEFAKEIGYQSIDDFMSKISEKIIEYKQKATNEALQQQILDKLIELVQFDLPPSMLLLQEDHLKKETAERLKQQQGLDEKAVEDHLNSNQEKIKMDAEKSVRAFILLDRIGHDLEVNVTEDDVNLRYHQLSEQIQRQGLYNMDPDKVASYYSKNNNERKALIQEIYSMKVLSKLLEKVEINDIEEEEKSSVKESAEDTANSASSEGESAINTSAP